MKWTVEYSRRADAFIEDHGIRDEIRDSILRISGSTINRCQKIERRVGRLLPHPEGGYQDYPETETRTIFVDIVDFRGSVYR